MRKNARVLMKFAGSSVITAAWYNKAQERLTVKFKSGLECDYIDVPWQVAVAMMGAHSVGRYFNRMIKNNYCGLPVCKDISPKVLRCKGPEDMENPEIPF